MNPRVTHALLVGISDYEQHSLTGQEIDLNGCVWDAKAVMTEVTKASVAQIIKSNTSKRNIRKQLRRLRKGKSLANAVHVVELLDSKATALAVRSELKNLCRAIKPGQAGLFYRSGHGTYINGSTEDDGTDEAFCAYDALNGGYVIDKEISSIISRYLVDGATLYVIADTCHSGDSTRGALLTSSRGINAPNDSIKAYHKERTFVFSDKAHKGVIAFNACASDELAYEQIDSESGKVRGVFTLAIQEHIASICDGSADLEKIHTLVSRFVSGFNTAKRKQTPQLERYG